VSGCAESDADPWGVREVLVMWLERGRLEREAGGKEEAVSGRWLVWWVLCGVAFASLP
jgi:hypothetical protein